MKASVVVYTYNRELYLPECLEHLKNQTETPENFEIVRVNNNSSDNTEEICQKFVADEPQLNVVYVKETQPELYLTRKKEAAIATGEVLCFTDDGFTVPEYVSTLKAFTRNDEYKEYIFFGGKVIPHYNQGKDPKWLSVYIEELLSRMDMGEQVKPFEKKYPVGCNMAYRKEFFEEHGGFNTDLHTRSDEKFVFDKLKRANLKILYFPAMEVEHFIDDYRLEKSFVIRLAKVIGPSEAIRRKAEGIGTGLMKFIEYAFKYGASLILALGFLFKGKKLQPRYLAMVRWYVLTGFFIRKKL